MGYLKIKISQESFDENGKRTFAKIRGSCSNGSLTGFESDIATADLLELNVILHSLAIEKKTDKKFAYTFPFQLG